MSEQLVGLGLVEVQHEHGNFLIRRCLCAQVAVDDLQTVGGFAREQRVGITDLGQDAL